jgi:GT2 family glycosyltransferase
MREALRRQARDGEAPRSASAGASAPTVSVIVVCWNAADVLGRCLDHLLAQDYPAYEIVVVDDGSTDETLAVADAASGHGDLTVVRSPRNRGCPHARNLGLARAGGEIVAFVDADGFAATDWLREVVAAFGTDETVGGVASTVFYDANPLVLNGAGGTVNRQGWAADLSMNEPYERAQIASEALYPMGCGMALRRSALDDVGPFDDSMLNYYDDVDYGVRLWRAGYRVVVAPYAWIDHEAGGGGDTARTRLLCERHRMRVALKHAPARALVRWAAHEARAFRHASPAVRARKGQALTWNALHLPSTLAGRRRLRGAGEVPGRLVDPSWGDGFPAGVPPLFTPRMEGSGSRVDMADPRSEAQLIYGWYPCERVDGRSYRWASEQAAALIRLQAPAKRVRLDYAHVPADLGGVELTVRRVGSPDPLTPAWTTRLSWMDIARVVENHPLALPSGDYEVVLSARRGWLEPPLRTRVLSAAIARISFAPSWEIASGGLDMARPDVDEQLVSGWFDPEQGDAGRYRWADAHAAAVVRLRRGTSIARLSYRLPPASIGGLEVAVYALQGGEALYAGRIPWADAGWQARELPIELAAGDYLVTFDTDATWSNPQGADASLWGENRSLGFALSSLSFGGGT